MLLKKIKTFIVGNPPPHFGGRYWIFIKLITDKDIVGYAEILRDPIQWEKGYVIPPNKPGLGVELNEDVANKHSYTGTKLHLEMAEI